MKRKLLFSLVNLSLLLLFSNAVFASGSNSSRCNALPSYSELKAALKANVDTTRAETNGGFDLNMWGTIVNRDGVVCAVVFTGGDRGDQWPGSRVISAQKAYTANAFSLPDLALSTANLFSAVQPGGSLFGLQFSNPVDPSVAYGFDGSPGNAEALGARRYGRRNDPLVGDITGGINVFGGGLALYNQAGKIVGAIGVSGDSSCADHNIAWRTREDLGLDNVPAGVGPNGKDGIDFLAEGEEPSGFQHPQCGEGVVGVAEGFGSGGL